MSGPYPDWVRFVASSGGRVNKAAKGRASDTNSTIFEILVGRRHALPRGILQAAIQATNISEPEPGRLLSSFEERSCEVGVRSSKIDPMLNVMESDSITHL
jgi:hypothetical protein